MFTGIVEEVGRVIRRDGPLLEVDASLVLEGLRVGDSIAVNGACLTITRLLARGFAVDLSPETLRRTNLGLLQPGDPVNLERPLPYGGRVGGHLVQGHVDATGQVLAITPEGNSHLFTFSAPKPLMRYIVEKGFIAVDGISLTVVEVLEEAFRVAIIPYTFHHTVLGQRQVGDVVNLEVDILAKYVERLLEGSLQRRR
ncbi:MAG: riboflavin synthase [Dehalococcoidia bacterium]|nr:riboflavin synthase [Dehalococcoidia bacterium]MDW8119575.1 riboflavin synthase [Chloroflexota bacterium]